MARALIIGGGVAGATTALALQRVGLEPVIFEARSEIADATHDYLTVPTNGLDALAALGVHRLVVESGFPVERTVFFSATGRRLGSIPIGRRLEDGTVSQVISRGRLEHVLLDEARRRGIRVELGRRLVGITSGGGPEVAARFDDETEWTGDLLVGADGVHSATRRLIEPHAAAPRDLGMVRFGGYSAGVSAAVEPNTWTVQLAREALFAFVTDETGGTVWWVAQPRPPIGEEERAAASREAWRARLFELFDESEEPARSLIAAGEVEMIGESSSSCRPWRAGIAARWSWWATPPTRVRHRRARAPRSPWRTRWCWPSVAAISRIRSRP